MRGPTFSAHEDQHSRVPYWVITGLSGLSGIQVKILLLIANKNSFDNATKEFSVRYLSVRTGEKKSTVHENLNKLLSRGILQVVGAGKRGVKKLDLPSVCPESLRSDCPDREVSKSISVPELLPNASVMQKDRPVIPDRPHQKQLSQSDDCPVERTLLSGDGGQICPVGRTSINTYITTTHSISTGQTLAEKKEIKQEDEHWNEHWKDLSIRDVSYGDYCDIREGRVTLKDLYDKYMQMRLADAS